MFDLTLLQTCAAVYRTGSLTKAARQLGLSQPAVTGQLRTLEVALGQKLFHRMAHGTVPTEAAHELIRDVEDPLSVLHAAMWRRTCPEKLGDRTVRLGGPVEMMTARVLPALAALADHGLRLHVGLGDSAELLTGLAEGLQDAVIVAGRPRQPGLISSPLMDEEYALVGSPRWEAAGLPAALTEQGAKALGDVPVIAYSGGLPLIQTYWLNVFGEAPEIVPQITVPDLRSVLAVVCTGVGLSVLPTYLCAPELSTGELRVIHPIPEPPLGTYFFVVRGDTPLSVGVSMTRSRLIEAARAWL